MNRSELFSQLKTKHLPYIQNSNVIKFGLIIFILFAVMFLVAKPIVKLAVLGMFVVFISIYMNILYDEILRILNIQFTNEISAQQTTTNIVESGLDEDILNEAINDPYAGGGGGGASGQQPR